MKILRNFLFSLLLVLIPSSAWAVVPPITDDTQTPGPNIWQAGIALTADEERDHTRYETPVVELDYGIGAERRHGLGFYKPALPVQRRIFL